MSPWVFAAGRHAPALTEQSTIGDLLVFQGVGLVIVLGALTAMYLLCAGVGALFVWAERRQARAPRPAPVAEGAAASTLPAELPIVVIAAAVASVLDAPHRIVEVRPVTIGWSVEGRRQHFTSHQLRK